MCDLRGLIKVRRRYNKPTYKGLTKITSLINMSKAMGHTHKLTSEVMDFNTEGYAFKAKNRKGIRSLIIDKDENGELITYVYHYGKYKKLIQFTDLNDAKNIIYELYNDPYYHSSSYYVDQLNTMLDNFDPTLHKNIKELEKETYNLYQRASFFLKQIKRGSHTFGCAHRFLLIAHQPYYIMNLYLSNFKDKMWIMKSKSKLIYEDEWIEGEYTYTYELKDITKDNFKFEKDPIFGFNLNHLDNCPFFEAIMLNKLSSSIFLGTVYKDIVNYIRVINQMAVKRDMFPSKEYLDDYVLQLRAVIDDPQALYRCFYKLYDKLINDAGYTVKVNSNY